MTLRSGPATVHYLGPCQGKPTFYGRQRWLDNLPLAPCEVRVADLRGAAEQPTLDREGFTLVPHRSAHTDVFDPAARAAYRRDLQDVLKTVTGARQ